MFEDVAGLPPFRRCEPPSWLPDAQLRRALRVGDLLVLRPGVLVGRRRAADGGHRLAVEAAIAGLRGGSQAHACLGSAAALYGLSRLGRPAQRVRLYRERGGPWRDRDVAVLVCRLPAQDVGMVEGVPATTLPRTVVDLGRWVTFRSGVVVADSGLRLGCTRREMELASLRCARWPGIRKARQVVAFADGRAESPLESISRVVFLEHGLPVPDLQTPLPDASDPIGFVDFYWEEFGVIGEADGLLKYDDDEKSSALRAEKLRQEALEACGYIVVRWMWEDIWRRPEWVVGRLRSAFREGARRRALL